MNSLLPRRACGRAGFTLIELLAVIAIAGVLASVLIPMINSARSRAMSAACTVNLRQCGVALTQYAQDNRQAIPTRWRQGSKWYGWNSFLQKKGYLDMNTTPKTALGKRIYSCPLSYGDIINTATDTQCYGINIDTWGPDGRIKGADLGEQSYLDESGNTYYIQSLQLNAIPKLSSFVLLADSFNKLTYQNSGNTTSVQKAIFGEPSSNPWMRHYGGMNALMGDGHVERITPDDIALYLSPSMPGGYKE